MIALKMCDLRLMNRHCQCQWEKLLLCLDALDATRIWSDCDWFWSCKQCMHAIKRWERKGVRISRTYFLCWWLLWWLVLWILMVFVLLIIALFDGVSWKKPGGGCGLDGLLSIFCFLEQWTIGWRWVSSRDRFIYWLECTKIIVCVGDTGIIDVDDYS